MYVDPSLETKDVAARLRQDLKKILPRPIRCFVAVKSYSSLAITVKGPNLLSDNFNLTAEGERVQELIESAASRYAKGDPISWKVHKDIRVRNAYSKQEVFLEATRLKEVYWIDNIKTLNETESSLWYSKARTPLTDAAFVLLYAEFKEVKVKDQGCNLAVTEAFVKWAEKSKSWLGKPNIQYFRGPKYWRLELNERVLCFVNRNDGTIFKESLGKVMTDSPRGTIFDGFNVFENGRLMRKEAFDWMVRFSLKTGQQFTSFKDANEYCTAQSTLQQLLGRQPTHEEIEQEIVRTIRVL